MRSWFFCLLVCFKVPTPRVKQLCVRSSVGRWRRLLRVTDPRTNVSKIKDIPVEEEEHKG